MINLKDAIHWYRKLPEKKLYLESISALLTIPVLVTVILSNVINLKKTALSTATPITSPPTVIPTHVNAVSTTPAPVVTVQIVYVTPTGGVTIVPTNTLVPTATVTPTPTHTPTPSPSPTTVLDTPTPSPTATPTPTATLIPSDTPILQPIPTL